MVAHMTKLEKYLFQIRRIEEHREKTAEKEIRKIYKEVLKELNSFLADIYVTYSKDDMLTYANLAAAGMDARFLEEVERHISGITPKISKEITDTVERTYEACYDGMRNAVVKAAGDRELLQQAFATVRACTPDMIRVAVNNPISGLTLKDRLEKHRKDIIYDIKQNIGVGLSNGDRYSTMARRISESLDGDYKKAVRIVRTEAHRARETGNSDAATAINEALLKGTSGYVMAKTWRTMQDERVRPLKAKGKNKLYNHVKMDGVTIPQTDMFELPSGAKCMCPSQTGVAGEDINCRCYLSYDLVKASELTKVQNGKKNIEEAVKEDTVKANDINMGNIGDQIPQEHVKEMQERVSKAPKEIRDTWNKYIEEVKIADTNSRSAYFSPSRYDYGVHINLNNTTRPRYTTVSGEKQLFKNEYGTIFHEIGHNIADAANKKAGGYSWHDISDTFKSKKYLHGAGTGYTLGEMVAKEASAKVTSVWNTLKEAAVKRGEKKSSVRKYNAYSAVADELQAQKMIAVADCMDMFEGATKGNVTTYCGHGKSYWKSMNVGVEAFAEMFDATINNPESLATIQKYFPQAYEIFIECLEDIGK